MATTTKVCPNCGCETFLQRAFTTYLVIVNGNGDQIQNTNDGYSFALEDKMTCTDCKQESHECDLVSEAHFHEVIALQDEKKEIKPSMHHHRKFSEEETQHMFHSDITAVQIDKVSWDIIKDKIKIGKRFASSEFLSDLINNPDVKLLMLYHNGSHLKNF